jgi:hypothetical protein
VPTINYVYSGAFQPGVYSPVFDPTGLLAANRVTGEIHSITSESANGFSVIVPLFAPFFSQGLSLLYKPRGSTTTVPLLEGIDYNLAYQFLGATRACSKAIYGGISLLNNQLDGEVTLVYQTLGGNWVLDINAIETLLTNQLHNPRTTSWEQVVNLPTVFPVVDHQWNLQDLVGGSHIVASIEGISAALNSQQQSNPNVEQTLNLHINDTDNPHQVTKEQIGLGNVEDFGVASNAEAADISITDKLMTPASTNAAVTAILNDPASGALDAIKNQMMPTGTDGDHVFYINDKTINNPYTIPIDKNTLSVGPIEIKSGSTVEIQSDSTWVIV